jgi:alpha-beta hydrolase superfamily lysophospholipase
MDAETVAISGPRGSVVFGRRWSVAESRAAVVLVHGFGDHSGRQAEMVDSLLDAGIAVHAYDLRGHGRSPGRRGHIDLWDDHRDDLAAVVDAAVGLHESPVFVLGQSLGGLIVLEYALRRPDGLAGVVAHSPALVPTGVGNWFLAWLARRLSASWPTFSVRVPFATEPQLGDDPRPPDPLVHGRLSARAATEAMAAIDFTRRHAGDLRVPLLIVHGTDDLIVDVSGSRRFVAEAPGDATLLEYPGVPHDTWDAAVRARIRADIVAWIDAHLPPAPRDRAATDGTSGAAPDDTSDATSDASRARV